MLFLVWYNFIRLIPASLALSLTMAYMLTTQVIYREAYNIYYIELVK